MPKRCLMTVAFAVLAVSTTMAQEGSGTQGPPKPAIEGPSLGETTRFIQTQLNEQGKVSTIKIEHDTLKGEDHAPLKIVKEVSAVSADPAACTLTWREVSDLTNVAIWDDRETLSLRDVSRLEVLPLRDVYNRGRVKNGHPELVSDTSPAVYVLAIYMSDGKRILGHEQMTPVTNPPKDGDTSKSDTLLFFREEELANRLAKAMVHAVELCGGGSRPEPF